jgi:hypothetical protein
VGGAHALDSVFFATDETQVSLAVTPFDPIPPYPDEMHRGERQARYMGKGDPSNPALRSSQGKGKGHSRCLAEKRVGMTRRCRGRYGAAGSGRKKSKCEEVRAKTAAAGRSKRRPYNPIKLPGLKGRPAPVK